MDRHSPQPVTRRTSLVYDQRMVTPELSEEDFTTNCEDDTPEMHMGELLPEEVADDADAE